MKMTPIQRADLISDRIVDLLNLEIRKQGFDPLCVHAGLCMGFLAWMRTVPPGDVPDSLMILRGALENSVLDIMNHWGVTDESSVEQGKAAD